ncbi:hypothetical protein AB0H28_04720 [Micromonospora sp. NPDC050980]|uniref:hypothetical protein n=1 Tax=Micromonospora sp. NPDC050980 TaxID=3155161 RepID=UPI0033F74F47
MTTRELDQIAVRATDLIYPGRAYPLVAAPVDADPVLYADAVRVLAHAGELSPADRDRASQLLGRWWPKHADGFRWLALTRALTSVDGLDQIGADRVTPALAWVRATLATSDAGRLREVTVAAQLADELLRARPDVSGTADLGASVADAAHRFSCAKVTSALDAAAAAMLATTAHQPCQVPATVRDPLEDLLRHPERTTGLQQRIGVVATASALVTVGAANRADFLAMGGDLLSALGRPEHRRGSDAGQAAVITVADAIAAVGAGYALPAAQTENLRRIIRSESRLPDAVGQADPTDTALAADLLRRLGRPAPGPVDWGAPLTLPERTVLALALDRRELPSRQATTLGAQATPLPLTALGYVATAYPGLCLPQARDLRRSIGAGEDVAAWSSVRLFHAALLVSATARCGAAGQRRLTDALTAAADGMLARSGTEQLGPVAPSTVPTIVNLWYLAETQCLLGRTSPQLPTVDELRQLVHREIGTDRINPDTTVRHLYAALRLTELVSRPGSCSRVWWRADQ